MDFLIDESFPLTSAEILQTKGHTTRIAARLFKGSPDTRILNEAIEKEECILTFDKDFGEMIFKKKLPAPPAVILFRLASHKPADPAELILKLIREQSFSFTGYLTVIHENKIRQKKLPQKLANDFDNPEDSTA